MRRSQFFEKYASVQKNEEEEILTIIENTINPAS
jgi:hypothetical protein